MYGSLWIQIMEAEYLFIFISHIGRYLPGRYLAENAVTHMLSLLS
jgi:hypothetical protein